MLNENDPKVKSCKEQITKLDLEIMALVQDIERCQGPLLSLDALNSLIEGKLQELRNKIQEFEFLAREQVSETKKVSLYKTLKEFKNNFLSVQSQLRKANLRCQLALEKDCKKMLLSSGKTRQSADKDVGTALSLTQNMTSLTRMMSEQVRHIENTNSSLVTSSHQINSTHEEIKNISGHIQTSRKLLVKYSRREFTDKLLIFVTLFFFFASVIYIIKKRLFHSATQQHSGL